MSEGRKEVKEEVKEESKQGREEGRRRRRGGALRCFVGNGQVMCSVLSCRCLTGVVLVSLSLFCFN